MFIDLYHRNLNKIYKSNIILFSLLGCHQFKNLLDHQFEWEDLCAHVLASSNPLLAKLATLRPANNPDEQPYLPPSEVSMNSQMRELLEEMILT